MPRRLFVVRSRARALALGGLLGLVTVTGAAGCERKHYRQSQAEPPPRRVDPPPPTKKKHPTHEHPHGTHPHVAHAHHHHPHPHPHLDGEDGHHHPY